MRRVGIGLCLGVTLVLVGLLMLGGCSNYGRSGSSGSGSGGSPGAGGGTSGDWTVIAKDFAFDPKSIQISAGESVSWLNEDSTTHNVEGDGGISSGDLKPGESYMKTFKTPGTYNYKCSIHPSMTGTVVVK
jgi:plastocyanin